MSYDEHLISMAGGDGEPDLDAIEAIIRPYASTVEERRGVHPDSVFTAAVDLLALVREQAAKLGRVEAQVVATEELAEIVVGEDLQAGLRMVARGIRAALTATEAGK